MNQKQVIQAKILNWQEVKTLVNVWKFKEEKMVFTNGCFDILHLGHIDYLMKAADLGQHLIVGLNSDSSVKTLGKGSSRPIQDEQSRAMIIASLHFVTAVVMFEENTPYELIKKIEPDVLVKGADYKIEDIVGYDVVTAKGGRVETIEYLPGYSTSLIEKKIASK